jgi:uncharacterized protein YoxC
MSVAAEILVIILSIFLAIFLLLGIILCVYLIKLTRNIRDLTDSASRTANTIESAVSGIARFTSPLLMAEMFSRYLKKFKNKKEKK